jgi:dienelactone hydrolase
MSWGAWLAGIVLAAAAGCSPGTSGTPTTSTAPASVGPSPSVAVVTASAEASVAASPLPSLDLDAARAAFMYPPAEATFEDVSSKTDGGVTTRDVTYESVDGRIVSALVVSPAEAGRHPALLFLHWYATTEPDGNRTEFLDDATALAGRGVVSLLPEQQFPWHQPPSGLEADHQAVIDQVVDLRVGLDLLLALPGVDADRVAVVGHDFGGMYAALLAGVDRRVDAAVVMAGVPHFADWYLRYWHAVARADEPAYRATMLDEDPVTFLPDVRGQVLFQFAESDQFV